MNGLNIPFDSSGLLWLAAIALYALTLVLVGRRRRGQAPPLRSIPLYGRIESILQRGLEAVAPLHIAIGARSLVDAAPEATQALRLVEHSLAELETAANPPTISCAEGSLLALSAAAERAHTPGAASAERQADPQVLLAASPLSYAPAVWQLTEQNRPAGQVCFGPYQGPEGLLLQEGLPAQDLERLAASAEIDAAALMMLGSKAWAVGEDVYAADGYLRTGGRRRQLAVEDALRLALLVAMVVGLALRLAGVWSG